MLRKIETGGALKKMRKVLQRCSEVFRYATATGLAEFNPAVDLSGALEFYQSNCFPVLATSENPDFLVALETYSGSKLVQLATKLLMIKGVRIIELKAALWQ